MPTARLTNTLICIECEAKMSPMEAYGKDKDTCPNPGCRADLELTDKGKDVLAEDIKNMVLNEGDSDG